MGHIHNAKSSLVPLIDRLNKYPIGLVDNDLLREILSILFTETEAFVASRFPLMEATLEELCQRTGMIADELQPVLESMADKGIIMDMPYGDTTYYLLMPGLIGFFEFTFMKRRTDIPMEKLARLMSDYFHSKESQYLEFFGSKTQLTRSLVYDEAIPVNSVITPYESAREIVKNASFGAVSICHCRHKREHEGETCRKGAPVEGMCISLGTGAQFLARRGFAEPKSTGELLAVIDRAHELKLTHVTDNIRNKPSFICNCCGCCCEIMAGVQMGFYNGVGKTSYLACVDAERCDYCGACFTACNVKAIRPRKGNRRNLRIAEVSTDICLGCGACVSVCGNQAIRMVQRHRYRKPPGTKRCMFMKMLIEKRRLAPFLGEMIRRAWQKFL